MENGLWTDLGSASGPETHPAPSASAAGRLLMTVVRLPASTPRRARRCGGAYVPGVESDSVRLAYSRLAEPYIEMFATGEHEHVDDLEMIRRHLTTRPGAVLDLGCGPGHLTRLLAAGGATVRGFDVIPEFIEHARKAHSGIEFELGSITELPLPDASVSGALCWYSLIHFAPEAIGGALTEIRRVLEPGGSLVVGFFVGDALEPFDHQVVTAYRWPIDDLAVRLKAAGLDETERMHRDQQGDRRPHGALVARAV